MQPLFYIVNDPISLENWVVVIVNTLNFGYQEAVIAAVCCSPMILSNLSMLALRFISFTAGLMNVSLLLRSTNPEASKCSQT
jgi:hypothetical protein